MPIKKLIALALFCAINTAHSAEYLTFYLGGQSNMDGYGYVDQLPAELQTEQDVMIFHGNGVFANQLNGGVGKWAKLKPGHGVGFKSDGITKLISNRYSNRFGPELSFAKTISQHFTGKKIAIIKYAVGGTGLHLNTGYDNWSPDFIEGNGQNQYDYVLNTFNNALSVSDIDGDGEADTLIPAGIIWMQGEADANASKAAANAYLANLTRLMGLLRTAFGKEDIPVIIGKITDSQASTTPLMPFIKQVHLAQQEFVKNDICAGYMTHSETYSYQPDDAWHYSSEGFINMGTDFANKFIEVIEVCYR
jgi:hypothetical protein